MLIEQAKSLGESFDALSNKNVKVFLFTGTIPATQAEVPFDLTDVLSVYTASAGAVETKLTYDSATGKIQFRPNSNKVGLDFKGSGPDVTREGNVYWCVPTSIATTHPLTPSSQFDFTDILTQDVVQDNSKYDSDYDVTNGETLDFEFGYVADIDGIDFSFPNSLNIANFTLQYWDSVGEQYVDITTVDVSSTLDQRIDFGATYNTTSIRMVFTGSSTNTMKINHIRFFSNNTSPATNYDTVSPVTWCMMFLDIRSHGADGVIDNWPAIWMDVGSALAPAELTLASTTINPAQSPRMIFCEIEGKHVEDV